MPVALTYSTARTFGRTTETNDPEDRSAGQFPGYTSAEILSADSGRISFNVGSRLTSTQGALLFYVSPTLASDDAGLGGFGRLFHIGPLASGILAYYDKGNTRIRFDRAGGTVSVNSVTWAANEALAVLVGWDASKVYAAVNGGTIQELASSGLPATFDRVCHVGTDDLGFNYLEIKAGQVLAFPEMPSSDQWEALAALRDQRPAAIGEAGVDTAASWIGEGRRVIYSSNQIDLNNTTAGELLLRELRGAGLGPMIHRSVETPLRDGSVYTDTKFNVRRLTALMAIVSRSDFDRVRELRRQITAAVRPSRGVGTLTYGRGERLYEIDALPDAAGAPFDDRRGEFAILPGVPFIAFDPLWRELFPTETEIASYGTGLSVPVSVPVSLAAGTSTTITNAGDVEVYPEILITGPVTDPLIRNATTDKVFSLDVEIPSGMTATIDMDARTAERSDGLNLIPFMKSNAEMWPLEPGDNEIEVGFDTADTRPVSFRVTHQTRLAGV